MTFIRLALVFLLLNTAGCSFVATYNPQFDGESLKVESPLSGKALVYTTKEDSEYTFSGKPTSFTGGGTTLNIHLGEITYRLAKRAFGDIFVDGADYSQDLNNIGNYAIVVKPRVVKYEYAYNQLKNAGFAITPQVDIDIEVRVLDQQGNPIMDKTYSSGLTDGKSYMLSGSPGEEISRTTHKVIAELLNKAANDTYLALKAR